MALLKAKYKPLSLRESAINFRVDVFPVPANADILHDSLLSFNDKSTACNCSIVGLRASVLSY